MKKMDGIEKKFGFLFTSQLATSEAIKWLTFYKREIYWNFHHQPTKMAEFAGVRWQLAKF